ncbi:MULTISPECIES: hypothetical protein [Actinoalloteichus]|uniref:Uncharacterized protein n=1 Tax=Actinoalloteichus fjordicus TaxID=1612552 RepID=A0AAC9L876_9PSEU|nr:MULTISPECIES: hypothetical protein [Actinoalloteichus]APU12180.1 hypothetical protein UA74_00405 [Actinoalloteichus fjordicus]APU18132.1 hypothetical protein UA75_00405 [Actinoalloteichus sp. GBA129-24]
MRKNVWDDEEAMGAALRDSVDGPAPMPKVGVDQVMRQGRRRAAVRRGATLLGAAGVVAGIGLSTVLAGGFGGGLFTPASNGEETDYQRSPQREQAAVEPLPGWTLVDGCPLLDQYGDEVPADLGPLPQVEIPSAGVIEPLLRAALVDQQPESEPAITFATTEYSEKYQSPRVAVNMDLVGTETPGSIYLEALPHHGSPTEAADRAAADKVSRAPSCEVVAQRMTLDDGTVVQIYGVVSGGYNANSPSQGVDVFHPANYSVSIDADGHLSTDFESSADDPAMGGLPEDAGTGVVPLTTEELAAVGLALAEMG